jgi:hypothetical protein
MMNKYTAFIFALVGITSMHAMHKEDQRQTWQQKREFQQAKSHEYQKKHNMLQQPSKVKQQERPFINDKRHPKQ